VRATDLLGSDVVDSAGVRVGHVHDLRMTQDGPPQGDFGAALRLERLLVGPASIGSRLGFDRDDMRGPWPLRELFRRLHRRRRSVRWDQIAVIETSRIRLRTGVADLEAIPRRAAGGPRVIDAGLELLDRQLIDSKGRMAGNVDDLELTFPAGGGPPLITGILAGPGALSRRLGGRLGRLITSIHERLQDRHLEGPARISFGVVNRLGTDLRLSVDREDLPTFRIAAWVRDGVIARIPGS
jgi:sporulation protein YlmC with PRC-barrel domain